MALPLHISRKIDKNGPVPTARPDLGPCWLWTGYTEKKGYGKTSVRGKYIRVHLAVYIELVGPVPKGLELDHLCRVKACCNPAHMEPVTHRVNTQRGAAGAHLAQRTHCPQGHPYEGANLREKIRASGTINRLCRACAREDARKRREKRQPP